jgi:hypothetical protein
VTSVAATSVPNAQAVGPGCWDLASREDVPRFMPAGKPSA